jgi:transcriptional regulator with XRE-family HTH domain
VSTQPQGNRVDAHIGGRVRQRRLELGLSPSQLGLSIGVSSQEVARYEVGLVRISASLFARVANALQAPISYFFAEMAPDAAYPNPANDQPGLTKH